MTEILEAFTRPQTNGEAPLPRRAAPKGLLPGSWTSRSVRVEYVVCGELRETTATLLDVFPTGAVLNAGGARTLIAWETIAVVELVND